MPLTMLMPARVERYSTGVRVQSHPVRGKGRAHWTPRLAISNLLA